MIRDLQLRDLIAVESFNSNGHQLPKLNSKLYPVQKVIEEDGKILGSAFLHLTSDVSIILDPSLSNLTRARLIKEFFSIVPKELMDNNLEDTRVFVNPENDTRYAEFLIRHFGFVKDKGIPLYLGV
jgi:hypothetical protein